MTKAKVRSYASPTMVLLAFDWEEGAGRHDFLGFAIQRTPGFFGNPSNWLPNRIGFDGAPKTGKDLDSNDAPVQKFMWWDARFGHDDVGKKFSYEVIPIVGSPGKLTRVEDAAELEEVILPAHVEKGIGTWFNRAVVSSQAFSRLLTKMGIDPSGQPSEEDELKLRAWLGNGLEGVVPAFIDGADEVAGAIYHLTDDLWIIPALEEWARKAKCQLVYDSHEVPGKKGKPPKPSPNAGALETLAGKVDFKPRDKTNIMHDKFLVAGTQLRKGSAAPARVLAGSANFTTEGLTQQANVLHTFESPELAAAYLERQRLIAPNPTLNKTAKEAGGATSARWGMPGCGSSSLLNRRTNVRRSARSSRRSTARAARSASASSRRPMRSSGRHASRSVTTAR